MGDLIYDQYLVEHQEVTVDLSDPRLKDIGQTAIELFFFWEGYFSANHVVGVFGNNAYFSAIPNRCALSRAIDVFALGTSVERVTLPGEITVFSEFPREFSKIPEKAKRKDIRLAANYLRAFVGGQPVEPLFGHTFKSFSPSASSLGLKIPAAETVVLIAPHNPFSDSPHAIGKSLFPDYGEWLEYLGALSESLDFTWLLKMHPDRRNENLARRNWEWLGAFCERFPHISLLPVDMPHGELIRQGVNAVLTVSGSIGFEYAACGIRVIHASPSNPHHAYRFNLSPTSLGDYEDAIRNLATLNWPINFNEVLEYFFMYMVQLGKSPFFGHLNELSSELKLDPFAPLERDTYALFLAAQKNLANLDLSRSLERFYESGDLRWYERHLS